MPENAKIQISINKVSLFAPFTWLKKGFSDFMQCPVLAMFYGTLFAFFTYIYWDYLTNSPSLRDVSAPLIALVIIVFGPISAISMYDVSRRLQKGEKLNIKSVEKVIKSGIKPDGSCPSLYLSLILIFIAIVFMVMTPLLYAVINTETFVNHNQPIVEAILEDILSLNNPIFIVVYFIFAATIGWIAFMISWFSFPLVLDTDIDPLSAASASLKASMANYFVMYVWIPIVGIIVVASLFTPYFIGLVVAVPVLAHATWHAYKDMIHTS